MDRHHSLLLITKLCYSLLMKIVVLIRKSLEKLSKEELIDELLIINSIPGELANRASRFDEFLAKYARLESELKKIEH